MKRRYLVQSTLTLLLSVLAGHAALYAQVPLGSAFTYQGQLKQSGAVVTGQANMLLRLYDAESAGTELAAVGPESADVVDGLFTVEVDFGVEVFDGQARWLEIEVEFPAGAGNWTTLSPRQPLTAVPYAMQTRGVYVDEDLNVGVGTTDPQAKLHVADGDLRADGSIYMFQDLDEVLASHSSSEGIYLDTSNILTGCAVYAWGTSNVDGAGVLHLRSRDGYNGVEIDGDGDDADNGIAAGLVEVRSVGVGGVGGQIDVENNDGYSRITMLGGGSGDGGTFEMFNDVGDRTILLAGEGGTGADLQMFNDAGVLTVDLDSDHSDAGTIGVTNGVSSSPKVTLDGDGTADDGGEITVYAADGSTTLLVDGQADNDGGLVSLRDDTSEETIALLGDDGTNAGTILLANRDGSLNVDTLELDAQEDDYGTGARIVGRAESGSETFILDTSDGSTGGAFMRFSEQDGSYAMIYSAYTKTLRLYDSDGTATISFDGQTGSKSAVVTTTDYGQRLLYAVESPEVWFEDFGSGQLINGRVRINLDPVFLQTVTVNAQHPLKVFVTLTDECNGVFVKKGSDHFTVHELAGGQSNATFDWRVVAKRKSLEDLRLEELDQAGAGVASESLAASEPVPPRVPSDGIDDPTAQLEEEQNIVPMQPRAPGSGAANELQLDRTGGQASNR